jgi:hypothetical protein
MAHVIIFTDRATRAYNGSLRFFNYPAGAYKLASALRHQGYQVLVVPNCLSLSWQGVKQIIEANSKNLLWVGLSTTLLFMKSSGFQEYREQWACSQSPLIDTDILFNKVLHIREDTELVWGTQEVNAIASWLGGKFGAPLLIGGAWITYIKDGNLNPLHNNAYLVKGYAEDYVTKFTQQRAQDKNYEPPFISSNGDYDDVAFKKSRIIWTDTDFVGPESCVPIEISRGCAFRCAYCNYPRKGTFKNYKDPHVLRDELIENYERWGVTRYTIMDDLYNDSKTKVRDLYDNCWSRLPFEVEWTSYMRLDLFYSDPESAKIIQASGAKMGSFGIETLHEKAGRTVGKGLGKRRILDTLQYLNETWKQDVLISGYFIAGLPHEPKESIQETMDWTVDTDLLYSASWIPLWVQPPDNMQIVNPETLDRISQDNEKFEIQWLDGKVWINNQGVTFDDVDRMCIDTMQRMPMGMRIAWSDYADLRTGGLSHEDIATIRRSGQGDLLLSKATAHIRSLIEKRLQKVLDLSDRP